MEKMQELTIAEAMNEVMVLSQQAEQMGRQDFEPSAFREIARRLTTDKPEERISPEEAVEKARALLDSKQMG